MRHLTGASATSMITRAELRQRWASLLGVAVLVALVTAAVLTALVGAHRSTSAVERFRNATAANDLEYQSDGLTGATDMLAVARAQPATDQAGLRSLVNVWPADGSNDIAIMSDPEGVWADEIDRPLVLEGRMPASDAPDEVLLNELAAEVTGLGIGDHIEANTWSDDDLLALFETSNFPGFNGPTLDLEVVGIGRTADGLSGSRRRTAPYAVGSPAFLAAHPSIGVWPATVVIRLHDGAASDSLDGAISDVQLSSTEDSAPGGFRSASTKAADVYLDTANTATASLVAGLLVFAVVAALAGGLAVGQAVQRQLAGSVTPSATLSALGSTRGEIARARSWPIGASALAGVVAGVAGAVALSPLLPIGLVRRAEIDQGVWIDPVVLVLGAVAIVALVWGWALLLARRQVGAATVARSTGPRRAPFVARLAGRAGSSPALAIGLRMAGDRGRGAGAVPVRSAFVGVALAVTGLLATGVVAASYHELSAVPAHWGVPWQASPDYLGDESIDDVSAALAADDRVQDVALYLTGSLVLNGQASTGTALVPIDGSMALTRLEGRLPATPTEIALGTQTADRFGLSIGDNATAIPADGDDPVSLTVVGLAVLPATDDYAVNVGAVLTGEGMTRFGQGDVSPTLVLDFPPDVDVSAVEEGLANDYGFDFNLFSQPQAQGAIANLAEPRDIAEAIAAFLVVLAVIGMAHVLLVSTRRRRHDLGVLRAMGLRGRQAERAVKVEALALTAAGLVVGIPTGVIVGRAVWQALTADLGAVADPQWPWLLLVVVVPVAALLALALSWWPALRVRRISPAESLRTE